MSICDFVEDSEEWDTRKFKIGEPVCLRDDYFTEGIYGGSHPQPGTGRIYIHKITCVDVRKTYPDRWVGFQNVGKKRWPVSKTALSKILREIIGDLEFIQEMNERYAT